MDDRKANAMEAVESVDSVEEGLKAIDFKVLQCQSSMNLLTFQIVSLNIEDF